MASLRTTAGLGWDNHTVVGRFEIQISRRTDEIFLCDVCCVSLGVVVDISVMDVDLQAFLLGKSFP